MSIRSTGATTNRMARMDKSRGTVRLFDGDQQLCQTIKQCDVFHSETHSDVELWEPIGHTAVALKQKDDQPSQSQQGQQSGQDQDRWNHKQPKGEAAEVLTMYLNGNRGHCIGICTDRRVRPYQMKEGTAATYAPDGSEQMLYFKQNGAYLVSLDGKSVQNPNGNETRMASLRHVTKPMQSHKIDDSQQSSVAATATADQQQQEYKHEGDKVNTEVRCTKDRIEFRAGDKVMGYFEVSSSTWNLNGKVANMDFSDSFTRKANQILDRPGSLYELEEGANSLVEGQNLDLSGKVKIKHALDDVPGGLRALEQRIADLEARLARLES